MKIVKITIHDYYTDIVFDNNTPKLRVEHSLGVDIHYCTDTEGHGKPDFVPADGIVSLATLMEQYEWAMEVQQD